VQKLGAFKTENICIPQGCSDKGAPSLALRNGESQNQQCGINVASIENSRDRSAWLRVFRGFG
jgi:hypothetical protein